ncbi:class II aminotransferase/8-amino-7-oxononanoate synthase [Corynespora cassiicola Philippines]|uniref:Class II aminotransferase/8-amino-7-oxononanoate synthase n=1 Tax=Corynespora cassiicola Philippines TaxID=1448308 RepID=A0A2T2NVW3_CORCC|nr:class II aminotransferase/8-amino-7-oxononanoate synthase [Corynespora cassiicola Philippines]
MSSSGSFVVEWAKAQQPKGPSLKNKSVFYRNLEAELDARRAQHGCMSLHTISEGMSDFASADTLGLGSSGMLREAFLEELAQNPNFWVGASGTRLAFGNTAYHETLEREVAAFYGAETALVTVNGGLANGAIFTSIPRPGDAIVYDEFIHATVHDGMKNSLALVKKPFRHNNVESFMETLIEIRNSEPLIRSGQRCVIVAVEGIYSMDGDLPPLRELVAGAKEVFPDGNCQFYIDEAHSTGVLGQKGAGLVCALGLENEIAIRMHSCPKAMAASGAMIVCNNTVKAMLLNNSRSVMFSGAPSFPMLAAIRAGYNLLKAGKTQHAQERVEYLVNLFMDRITSHPVWDRANDTKTLRVPLWDLDEEVQPFVTPILPIMTRPNTRQHLFLTFHLQLAGFVVYPVYFPIVPKGTERVRIIFHASHTDAEVEALAACICGWAEEMLEIDAGGDETVLPKASRRAYNMIDRERLISSSLL